MLTRSRRAHAALFALPWVAALVLAACASTPQPSFTPTAPAAQVSPSPTSGPYTPPPLNARETKVVGALASIGLQGKRAELPFENAAIWVNGGNWQLFVNAARIGTTRSEFSVIDERRLEGVRVQIVRYSSGPPPRHRFECAGDTYEVRGDVPPGFADMDAVVGRFIRALGCAA